MNQDTILAGQALTLKRYPITSNCNLQAWDAADHHLLKTLQDQQLDADGALLLNDAFGALACGIQAERFYSHTDSKVAQLGCIKNLSLNGRDPELNWLAIDEPWPESLELVLMKLPRNLNQLDSQLQKLSQTLRAGARLLIGGKAKLINRALVERCARQFGQATPSLAWKNTRVIECVFDGQPRATTPLRQWPVPEYDLTLSNMPNVFAGNSLDIGARAILPYLPEDCDGPIVDLGCGNGVLGLRAGQLNPNADIHFVDESAAAVQSAELNWQENLKRNGAQFHWSDCLSEIAPLQAQWILCNPPFHQGDAITDHIAWQMLKDSHRHLCKGGQLLLVGNRHLGYHVKLKRVFGNSELVASDNKFVVLVATKN
ncbi:methyltransferase [Paraferrimonas sedimenticola]